MAAPSQPGIRRCQACQWLFVSLDWLRLRRCNDCKQNEDRHAPREARMGVRDGEKQS